MNSHFPISTSISEGQDAIMAMLRHFAHQHPYVSRFAAVGAVVVDGIAECVRHTVKAIENVANAIFHVFGAIFSWENYSIAHAISHVEGIGHSFVRLGMTPVKVVYNLFRAVWDPSTALPIAREFAW